MSRQTIVVLLVAGGILCQGCASRMLYYPTDREYGRPSDAGYSYEEVTFPSRDGTRLAGWFVPAVGPPKGTVLHFHGNAQNMTAHFSFVSWLPREGFNVLIFHGTDDGVVPFRHGRLLFERAREPRMLVSIPHGGHTVALVHQDPAFRKQLVDFYERACAGSERLP